MSRNRLQPKCHMQEECVNQLNAGVHTLASSALTLMEMNIRRDVTPRLTGPGEKPWTSRVLCFQLNFPL